MSNPFAGQAVDLPGKVKPPVPPASGGKPQVSNPFAGQAVELPGKATASPALAASASPSSAVAGSVKPTAAAEPDDPELVPGSRKDLWKCPHCGAGNRPERDTCRACGKHRDAPVAAKWYANPVILGGIALALAVVVALWVVTRPDFTLRPAGPQSLTGRTITGGGGSDQGIGDGIQFHARGRIAWVGRVAATGSAASSTLAVYALAKDASDDAAFAEFAKSVVIEQGAVKIDPATAKRFAVFSCYLVQGAAAPEVGSYHSVVGDSGTLSQALLGLRGFDAGPVVVVRESAVAKGR
ncbi:hypothetical protein LBMAG53_02850 [Planctomycetota bacterium]|nr:hypothetical protein LBMAG53_02850 [Planctomycetota bacterium]